MACLWEHELVTDPLAAVRELLRLRDSAQHLAERWVARSRRLVTRTPELRGYPSGVDWPPRRRASMAW